MVLRRLLPRLGMLALLPALLVVGCAVEKKPAAPPTGAVAPVTTTTKGTYVAAKAAAGASSNAYIYDALVVPSGSSAEATMLTGNGKTIVHLTVNGYLPDRAYGAHLHAKPCGVDPKDAGPHFQYEPDPAASSAASVDPTYANPDNEVWLDFTTDANGNATAVAEVAWVANADRRPASLVIHTEGTHTEAGKAGGAGARVSCLTLNR